MSKNPLRGAAQVARTHPVYSVLGLLVAGGAAFAVINRRNSDRFDDVELPEATEPRDTGLAARNAQQDDSPLKDLTRRDGTEGDDPITREIRP